MVKPSSLPEWDATQVNSIVPDATHKAQGWLAPGGVPEKPPFQTFNYWMNEVYLWLKHFDDSSISTIGNSAPWNGAIANIPTGFLLEDGSAISRTTYAELFAAIGTIHGVGDGSTTFNLPDSSDRVVMHADADAGGDYNPGDIGDGVGAADGHLLTSAQSGLKAHAHNLYIQGSTGVLAGVAGNTGNGNSAGTVANAASNAAETHPHVITNYKPKFIAKAWITKAF